MPRRDRRRVWPMAGLGSEDADRSVVPGRICAARVAAGLAIVCVVVVPAGPSWARPAGQNGPIIAFEGHRPRGADIFLMALDGTSAVNATNDDRYDGQP